MDVLDFKKRRLGFLVPENLFVEFKENVFKENTTIPMLITQFMMNYIDCLDSSFFLKKESYSAKMTKKIQFGILIPADVCSRFKEKTIKDGVKMSTAIEQFIVNYVNFMKHRKRRF
jgi:hypothetical protein